MSVQAICQNKFKRKCLDVQKVTREIVKVSSSNSDSEVPRTSFETDGTLMLGHRFIGDEIATAQKAVLLT